MKIVVGTYGGLLYGYTLNDKKMKLTFGYTAHASCIKSVAFIQDSPILLSGGADEIIKIYNVAKRVEVGNLLQHTGPVLCLEPFGKTHVLSGSADHTVCIWRTSDWNCVHILGGHKEPVLDIAVHPTGKLALSVSKDKTLRMWNLIKGRCAFIKRLTQEATNVFWNHDGSSYGLVMDRNVVLFDCASGETICTLQHPQRIHTAAFFGSNYIACAGEMGYISICHVDGTVVGKIQETELEARVRSMNVSTCVLVEGGPEETLLTVATSKGYVQVWDLKSIVMNQEMPTEPVATVQVAGGARITSLAVSSDTEVVVQGPALPSTEELKEAKPIKVKKTLAKIVVEYADTDKDAVQISPKKASNKKKRKWIKKPKADKRVKAVSKETTK